MNKNFLLKKNNHITSVDVLNKFLSKSSFKTIKIERIQFKFSSKDFIPLSHNLESLNIISRLNILTLIYLMLGIFPHITAVKKKILKKLILIIKKIFFYLMQKYQIKMKSLILCQN